MFGSLVHITTRFGVQFLIGKSAIWQLKGKEGVTNSKTSVDFLLLQTLNLACMHLTTSEVITL